MFAAVLLFFNTGDATDYSGSQAMSAYLQEEDAPRRMSLRQRGVASDGVAVDEELRGGKVVVISGERIRLGPHALLEPSPKDRHPKGIPLCTCGTMQRALPFLPVEKGIVFR
jgi:hypothetical protein